MFRTTPFHALAVRLLGRFVLLGLLLVAIMGSVGPATNAGAAELDEVVGIFASGQRVYIEPSAIDPVTPEQLQDVVIRADNGGINLYIAVLGDGGERVSAELVRDALGEVTVAVFTPKQYRLATGDICVPRFDEARAKADIQLRGSNADIAVGAFVDAALTLPACDGNSDLAGLPWWAFALGLVLFAGAGFFVLRSMSKSRRATDTARGFEERRDVLRDWALSLRAPITQLQQPVTAARSPQLTKMYTDALEIAKASEAEVMGAQGMPDLDRAEMRIARAQMQVRDLNKALGNPAAGTGPGAAAPTPSAP